MPGKVFRANNGAKHSAPFVKANVLESKPIPRVELEMTATTWMQVWMSKTQNSTKYTIPTK